jgi:KDO2-lipid IV(A) lauroyltransferase
LLLRGALAVLDRLSVDAAARLARLLADTWWVVDHRRRQVARDNILASGITSDRDHARRLARLSTQHFALVVIESLKSESVLADHQWTDLVSLRLAPDVEAVLEDPERGLIVVSGHFGNWEIAAQFLSRYKPVAGITRPMNNPRVESLIQRRKPRYRFRPIPKYDSDARRFLSILKQGEILALLTDQRARTGGVPVTFFGRPMPTYSTAAMLHLVTGTPLCFAACRRTKLMHFELTTTDLIHHQPSGDKQRDVSAILETMNRHLEAAILTAPEQYLWGHRRWRD